MIAFIDFVIGLLEALKTGDPVDQAGAAGALLSPFIVMYGLLRRNTRAVVDERDTARAECKAATGRLKDQVDATRTAERRIAELERFSGDDVAEALKHDMDEGNTQPAVKRAEAYLAHHYDGMRLANEVLQKHFLARFEEGLSGLRRARTTTLGRLACEPGNARLREDLDLIEAQLRIDAAPVNDKEALKRREEEDWLRKKLAADPEDMNTLIEVGRHLRARGHYRQAEEIWRRALTLCLRPGNPARDTPLPLTLRFLLAQSILFGGRYAEAEAALRDLLPDETRIKGAEHPETLTTRHTLANAILTQGRAAEAEAALSDLLLDMTRIKGAEHPHTLTTRRAIARAALEQAGKDGQAAVRAEEVLAPLPEEGGDADPLRIGQTLILRGWLADIAGDADKAAGYLERARGTLSHLTPEHYARRELQCYLDTRTPGGPGGTTLWAVPVNTPS